LASPPRFWPAIDVIVHGEGAATQALEERLLLLLDDLGPIAMEASDEGVGWRVFFAENSVRDGAVTSLAPALRDCCAVRPVDVEDEGWAQKVQADLRAIEVGRIVVAPPWEVRQTSPRTRLPSGAGHTPCTASSLPPADSQEILIVIEPSMGFGTGHHQSTRLCLLALQALSLDDASVIDVGTGSGVLALAACKLGASRVLAIDHDPDSVTAARDNAVRNGLTEAVVVQLAEVDRLTTSAAEVVAANLTAGVLRAQRDALARLVADAGRLIVSGFTRGQTPLVIDAFPEFSIDARREEDDWVCLTLRRRT
jgi:ribosomal protein L11 methyltransferase